MILGVICHVLQKPEAAFTQNLAIVCYICITSHLPSQSDAKVLSDYIILLTLSLYAHCHTIILSTNPCSQSINWYMAGNIVSVTGRNLGFRLRPLLCKTQDKMIDIFGKWFSFVGGESNNQHLFKSRQFCAFFYQVYCRIQRMSLRVWITPNSPKLKGQWQMINSNFQIEKIYKIWPTKRVVSNEAIHPGNVENRSK